MRLAEAGSLASSMPAACIPSWACLRGQLHFYLYWPLYYFVRLSLSVLAEKRMGSVFFMQNSHFCEPALLVFLYSSQPSSLSFPFLFCLSQAFFPALSSLLGEAKIFFPKNAILEKSTSRFLRGFLFSPLLHLPGLLFSRLYKHLRPRALDRCNVKQRLNSPQQQQQQQQQQQGVEEEAS